MVLLGRFLYVWIISNKKIKKLKKLTTKECFIVVVRVCWLKKLWKSNSALPFTSVFSDTTFI